MKMLMEKINLRDEMKKIQVRMEKVEIQPKRRSLFNGCPDEMVLIILSFGDMEDIQSTRVWQTDNVQHCTESICKVGAAANDNLDNLKWIYNCIEDTKFMGPIYKNCSG